METLNNVPFIPQMPIFGKVEDLASTAAMTPKEFEAYQDCVDAYRTTMASYEFYEKKGYDDGLAEGRQEGRQEGRDEGRIQERLVNAKSLKASGLLTDAQIAEILHIGIDDVRSL